MTKYNYDKAVQLYIDGMSTTELFKLGFPQNCVTRELRRRGIKIRNPSQYRRFDYQKAKEMYDNGERVVDIAALFGCCVGSITRAIRLERASEISNTKTDIGSVGTTNTVTIHSV